MELYDGNDIDPICPHCEKPITKLLTKEIKSFFGRRYVYFCFDCKKILGISHRKGYWIT